MDTAELDAIRQRDESQWAYRYHEAQTVSGCNGIMDRRALLAEVDRLRAKIGRVRALAEESDSDSALLYLLNKRLMED